MTTVATSRRPTPKRRRGAAPPRTSSWSFGITGDLAKVMTFRSLYRLERRGLLDCPIVGVAVDDWTVDQLKRARARVDRGRRRAARPEGLRALRGPSLLRRRRLRRPGDLRSVSPTRSTAPQARSSTSRSRRSCSARVVKGLSEAGLTENARVVVEKPFGHDLASARSSRRSSTSTSTSRSSTGSTTSSGRWARTRSSTCASPTRCSSRSGTATTSSACRSRWPRASASRTAATSTTRSARCATSSSTT